MTIENERRKRRDRFAAAQRLGAGAYAEEEAVAILLMDAALAELYQDQKRRVVNYVAFKNGLRDDVK
jgi:hypothetical protein